VKIGAEKPDNNLNIKIYNSANTAISILFVLICLLHYFSQRPLWLDEGFIYQNLTEYSDSQLLGPLKHAQAFPRGHLFLSKYTSVAFDYHVLALRFLPLIFMITAFFLWSKVYVRNFSNHWAALLAVFSFVVSYKMTYYAAELKPYAMDVLAIILFFYFFQYQNLYKDKAVDSKLFLLSVILPFLCWMSYAGIFLFWIIGLNYLLMIRTNKKLIGVLIANIIASIFSLSILYQFDLKYSMNNSMFEYWGSYLICTDNVGCFFDTFFEGFKRLATYWFGYTKLHTKLSVIFIPFLLFSLIQFGFKNWKEDKFKIHSIDSLGFILFFELFVMGIFKIYPFTGGRITLFLAPFVFYFILKAIQSLRKIHWLESFFLLYYGAFCLFCLGTSLYKYFSLYFP